MTATTQRARSAQAYDMIVEGALAGITATSSRARKAEILADADRRIDEEWVRRGSYGCDKHAVREAKAALWGW
jgi:hypothetical protein